MSKSKVSLELQNNNCRASHYLALIGERQAARIPPLPTAFSPSDKSPHISVRGLSFQRIEYKGPGELDTDSAQVRSNHPIPLECGVYYFEVKVLNKGKSGFIGIGVGTKDVRVNKLPGWEKGSYGYHGDDGKKFSGCGIGNAYGTTYSTGDIIGCIVNYMDRTITYTLNGESLGVAFTDVKETELYCTVGMRTEGECLEANFGSHPYRYDFAAHLEMERAKSHGTIQKTPFQSVESTCMALTLSYLIQEGYIEAATAFAKSCGKEHEVMLMEKHMSLRKQIVQAILKGDITIALALLQSEFPRFFDLQPDLVVMLKCQEFIEMVKRGEDIATILEHGTKELQYRATDSPDPEDSGPKSDEGHPEAANSQEGEVELSDIPASPLALHENENENEVDEKNGVGNELSNQQQAEIFEKVFSLLAYTDPYTSPNAFLLDPAMLTSLSENVNVALRVLEDGPAVAPLERISQHTRAVLDHLQSHSMVGLLMKDVVSLGYGEGPQDPNAVESQVKEFHGRHT